MSALETIMPMQAAWAEPRALGSTLALAVVGRSTGVSGVPVFLCRNRMVPRPQRRSGTIRHVVSSGSRCSPDSPTGRSRAGRLSTSRGSCTAGRTSDAPERERHSSP